jgi:phosphorylase kinase alpha/beta subunit
MTEASLRLLEGLRYPSGLFAASAKTTSTGYSRVWLRDNVYAALGFEAAGRIHDVVKTYRALLDILVKHQDKIRWMIRQPQDKSAYRYIHARYDPETGNEIWDQWGNKQNDAIGAILFKIGELERKGVRVCRGKEDLAILQLLVDYLCAIEYWHDADNGMWEEVEEVHASSVGACVAGLRAVSMLVDVPAWLIQKGIETLNFLLPRESATKETDLALLSLIYPYDVATPEQRESILHDVEALLVRERGVIRYEGDKYYNRSGVIGNEAEWTMGLVWLAIIYKRLNKPRKYALYMRKAAAAMNDKGELPELYYAQSSVHNENSPLGWAQSLYVVAREM